MADFCAPEGWEVPGHVRANDYTLALVQEDLDRVLEKCRLAPYVALDTETTGLDPYDDAFVGFCVGWERGHAVYIPVAHNDGNNADSGMVAEFLRELAGCGATFVYHNAAFDISRLQRWWRLPFTYDAYHDTQAMCYRLNPCPHTGLKRNVERYLGYSPITMDDLFPGRKKNDPIRFATVPTDVALWYAAADADNTLALFLQLHPLVQQKFGIEYQMDRKLAPVVEHINRTGVAVHEEAIKEVRQAYKDLYEQVRVSLSEQAGFDFNPNSNKQVPKFLYEVLGLPVLKRSKKTGAPCTDKGVILRLRSRHPAISELELCRSFAKRAQYCTQLLKFMREEDDPEMVEAGLRLILPNYKIFWVETNRFACEKPNLQQIPRPPEEGQMGGYEVPNMRSLFRPRPGYRFIEADYAAVEVRIFAAESRAKALLDAFEVGGDPHAATAAQMFHRGNLSQVTKSDRQQAKTINFGLFYGMQVPGLAERLNISVDEAQNAYDAYFQAIPEAKIWMEQVKRQARKDGGVFTKFGHFRPLPDLRARGAESYKVEAAEREAVNTIIQGTAGDVLRLALIRLYEALLPWEGVARIVLTTHDSVLFEVAEEADAPAFETMVRKAMELCIPRYPKLIVDLKEGLDYGDLGDLVTERPELVVTKAVVLPEKAGTVLLVSPGGAFDFEVGRRLADALDRFKPGDHEVQVDLGDGEVATLPGTYQWNDRARDVVRNVGFLEVGAPVKVRVNFD